MFLVTELYEPAGGLHRYTTNLLSAWEKAIRKGKTDLEPVVVSVKGSDQPKKDLEIAEEFSGFMEKNDVKVFKGERGNRMCYFLEGEVPNLEEFHWKLWNRYGIDSTKTSKGLDWYNDILSAFWYWVPIFAEYLREEKGMEFKCIDAQDWLSFPGGFLTGERLNLPVVCRIHSGEYGRSLGSPDQKDAPIQIETAALSFSDYIQGVSISETIFQINHLMPMKERMDEDLRERRGEEWYRYQNLRNEKIKSFLLYESESDMTLLKDVIGGMPNGIDLEEWKDVGKDDISKGKKMLSELLPGKDKFVFFIGRTSYRKGLDFLLETFSKYRNEYNKTGLVVASSMDSDTYKEYKGKLEKLGIGDNTRILNRWLEPTEKKKLMCASDVIALPSVYEPFGIVALEGLAADFACERNGTTGPVTVVGNTGGMSEIIKSGVNGFEVPIHNFEIDPDMLHRALIKALDEDKKASLSKKGAERVQDIYFRWEHILGKIFEVYDKAEKNWKEKLRYV